MTTSHTPLVLIIRDGWGENPHPEHDAFNAIARARTPVADALAAAWPTTLVRTSGEDVGLPAGTMGNSEVGHQNIGAGRIVDQELMRITRAIRSGEFAQNGTLRTAFAHAIATAGRVHLMGLVSDGRVHSDLDHFDALIDLAVSLDVPADQLVVHAITDGRDTVPTSGLAFVRRIATRLEAAGVGRLGSVMGRYYAMDRDHRWDRVARAYAGLTGAPEVPLAATAEEAITRYYDHPSEPQRRGDEFIEPTRIADPDGEPVPGIGDGDAVIFFNFRGDRPREITRAFVLDDEAWASVTGGGFDRGPRIDDLFYCTLTSYEEGLPVEVAFPRRPRMAGIMGAVIAAAGLTQLRCAETEKFAHVTFFFNDYREPPFDGEHRVLVPSPRDVSTYDQKPEMSAAGVRDAVLARLADDDVEPFLLVNFANPDMVGHTGNLDATIRAVETVDACVGSIVEAALARAGVAMVTADHGNAEQMWDPELNVAHTAHTAYRVPLVIAGEIARGARLRADARLGDLAPTVLSLMGLDVPPEMTGRPLLERD